MTPPADLHVLLGELDWIHKLARSLVADSASGDDLAQDTWLAVLRRPPRAVRDLRAYLATLLRRRAQRERRADQRRATREQAVAHEEALPATGDAYARVAMHRELAEVVLALAEPYRSAIVLRYFEGRDLDDLAAHLAVPRNTVRSRLQRGLEQLRARLDARGGRERWWPAVTALALRAPEAASAVAGGKLLGLLAVALALCGTAWWWFAPSPDAAPTASLSASAEKGAESSAEPAASGVVAPAAAERAERVAVAAAPERQLVDLAGAPLAGVRMRAESPFAVRWQGGDPGWISGRDGSLRIRAADERRLRSEPAFAAEFFARFAHPQEWRATVLDEPIVEREVITADDGGFAFAGLAAGDGEVVVCDPRFVLVSLGAQRGAPWRAGPATRVSGRIRGRLRDQLLPIGRAKVTPLRARSDDSAELPGQPQAGSDDDGEFLLRKALAGGAVRIAADGYAPVLLALTDAPEQRFDVLLEPLPEGAAFRVSGTVVDAAGSPIAGARVWFARQDATTAADGRFAFTLSELRAEFGLTVLAAGRAPFQRDRLGAELAAPAPRARDLIVVLGAAPLRLSGVVLDAAGAPRAGLRVALHDPALLDVSFVSVEARAGGAEVESDAQGRFSLGGLSDRSYRVRAVDPQTGESVVSAPLRAGRDDLVLRLPGDARRDVRGRVLAAGVEPRALTVAVAWCTHVTKGGGYSTAAAPAVACDGEGRFTLPVLPRERAWLEVRAQDQLRGMLPVEALAESASEPMVVDCDGPRWLRLLAGAQAAPRRLAFVAKDGQLLAAVAARGAAVLDAQGDCAPLRIPTAAAAVVLDPGAAGERRLELTDDRAVILRVR